MTLTSDLKPKRYDVSTSWYTYHVTDVEAVHGEYVKYIDYLKLSEMTRMYEAKFYDVKESGQLTYNALHDTHADLAQANKSNVRLLTELDALKARGFWAKFQDLIPG